MIRFALLLALLLTGTIAHARRVAIIIANETYANEARLSNPVRDARAIAAALGPQGAKFDEVRLLTNLDLRGMRRAIGSIAATSGADALVVYFSGHGIRDEARRNFLLPVEANISRPEDIAVDGIDAEDLVQAVRAAQPKLGLIVLDACRNNPFTAAFGNRSTSKGLARRGGDGLNGVLVAYAAEGGQVADDGRAGTGSPFALAFARRIATPGTPLLALLDQVADDVAAATDGKQTPTRDGNLRASAMLIPAVLAQPAAPPPVVLASVDLEREMWDLCKSANGPAPCRAYLNRYAAGTYAELAKLRLDGFAPVTTYVTPAEDPATVSARTALAGISRKMWISSNAKALMTAYTQAGGTVAGLNALAAQNDANAMAMLGLAHAYGAGGVVENAPLAVRWLTAAANAGQSAAQFDLAWSHETGRLGLAVNMSEAARLYRPAADQGDYYAQANLASMYANGRGVPLDTKEAARLYKLPAAEGIASAQGGLGYLYDTGDGVAKDLVEAARLYKMAADQGDAYGLTNLGVFNELGKGVPQNKPEAARLYKLAADKGYSAAQTNLGFLYENGQGVPQNKAEAARLYKLAADKGFARGQFNLGYLYENGAGVPQNKTEAARLYKLASDQGYIYAHNNLATLYELGEGGLPQDRALAIALYRKSAAGGNETAVTNLKRLGITP